MSRRNAVVAPNRNAGEVRLAPSAAAGGPITELIASADSPTSAAVFEPVLPDATALAGMGSVVILCVVAGLVWANSVVPVSRTKLAISKSRGEVKDYLDGLREDPNVEGLAFDESDAVATALNGTSLAADSDDSVSSDPSALVKPNVGDGRDLERWLFSDWLNSRANAKAGRQKEPALPVLKDAKWNSGDNPVLVTSALLGLCVVLASVTERVGSMAGPS